METFENFKKNRAFWLFFLCLSVSYMVDVGCLLLSKKMKHFIGNFGLLLAIFNLIIGKLNTLFSLGDTINCLGLLSCDFQNLTCASGSDCIVNCLGVNSCQSATIYCPEDNAWDCTINVGAVYALATAIVYAQGSTSLIISNVTKHGLFKTEVYCPENGLCYYQSNNDYACNQCIFYGYENTSITLIANGQLTFYYSFIYASNAKSLSITSTVDKYTFIGCNIYCPINGPIKMYVILCIYILILYYYTNYYTNYNI